MRHEQVDSLMKNVQKYYNGDFLVNGDSYLSSHIADVLRRKEENRFYGNKCFFLPSKMYCTKNCKKYDDCIIVPQGEMVYGPYFTFPRGNYTVKFCLEQIGNVVVSVFCTDFGVLASKEFSSQMKSSTVFLDFFLPKDVTEQLEFRVENLATTSFVFSGVEVNSIIPEDFAVLGYMNDVLRFKQQCNLLCSELEKKAGCNMPEGVRLRWLKLFFLRLMHPFSVPQIDFNRSMVATINAIQQQIDSLCVLLTEQQKDVVAKSNDSGAQQHIEKKG